MFRGGIGQEASHSYSLLPLYSLSDMRATIILQLMLESTQTDRWGSANAPVEIIEERQKIKPELEEAFRFVSRQRSKNLCRVVHVVFIPYPKCSHYISKGLTQLWGIRDRRWAGMWHTCWHWMLPTAHLIRKLSIGQRGGRGGWGRRVRCFLVGQTKKAKQ